VILFSAGISRGDLRRLIVEVAGRRNEFLREWKRIHG